MAAAPENNPIMDLRRRANDLIWKYDSSDDPLWKRFAIRALRTGYAVCRDLADGQLNLRAMSLVYTTLITIVPMLAISFSVLKGLGFHNELQPRLEDLLEPLGEKRFEIVDRIIEFVEKVNVEVLGVLGLGLLIYSVISLMHKIEASFNYTWRISRDRSFADRFSDYLSVLLIAPLFLSISAGLTTSARNNEVVQMLESHGLIGPVFEFGMLFVPWIIMSLAFMLIYIYMPNTRVRARHAFVGGLFSAFMWKLMGWAFSTMIAGSANYVAVYAAFATLIIFMIWLYLSWLVMLLGASIAYYQQNPNNLYSQKATMQVSNRMREKLAVLVCYLIGDSLYNANKQGWTLERLTRRMRIPMIVVEGIVGHLEDAGMIAESRETPAQYLPCRPFDELTIGDVVNAIRSAGEERNLEFQRLPHNKLVDKMLDAAEAAQKKALAKTTIKDLVLKG